MHLPEVEIIRSIVNKRILIAVLDWGMGHLTRTTALIHMLKAKNTIIFAGNPNQLAFIEMEFEAIELHELEGYDIQLDAQRSTYLQLANQYKKFAAAIKKEQVWIQKFVEKHSIDLIISDNRYGFRHNSIESIILTHQLTLQVPFFKNAASRRIKKYVNQFDACWVPDYSDQRLTGSLSNHDLAIPVQFIGPLNRFAFLEATSEINKTFDTCIILSGPEPERTNFMNQILKVYRAHLNHLVLVGANNGSITSFVSPTSAQLKEIIEKSDVIVTRAGYTSIMELLHFKKKVILYPTKGQYEQMYLSQYIQNEYLTFKDDYCL